MRDMVYKFQPALIIAARIISGFFLAGAASMVSITVAWGLFIFASSQSAQAWFILQLCAAGMGAGSGSILAWFNIDRNTKLLVTMMVTVAILGGLAGAWAGYEYGAYRNALCCDKGGTIILLRPVTYSAVGSALLANLAMLIFALVRNRMKASLRSSHPPATLVSGTEYRSVNR
ncbi:MAG: hypothetical protein BZY80_01255 [SAR202 cluster bacterium Io17-Chloro-G2]|nr:MAG: hypothetical protein BZY80_01255 [SAR202 cluster bacterium Io17-Chloro-G2]